MKSFEVQAGSLVSLVSIERLFKVPSKKLGVKYCCLSDKLNDMNMRWKVEGGRWKVRPIIFMGHINCEVDSTVFPAMTLLT